MRLVISLLCYALLVAGCDVNTSNQTIDLRDAVVLSGVRQFILRQNILTEKEIQDVCAKKPDEVSMYIMSGSFGQYKWRWLLDKRKSITVSYEGVLDGVLKEEYMSYVVQ